MRTITCLALAVLLLSPLKAGAEDAAAGPLQPTAAWEAIRFDVTGDAELLDGSAFYAVEAPFRAQDAATVPVRFRQMPGAPDVRRLTLVIDDNPSPVAGSFTFEPAMLPVDLETRVRVDAYTNVRAIVESTDGRIFVTGGFVRASGGCSAPAAKDAAAALAGLGQVKIRRFGDAATASGSRVEAQVMLRHPNASGMQRDPVSLLFVPARYVDAMEVRQGDALLFSMEGGISLSEDPTFRFSYADNGQGPLSVRATDIEGAEFEGSETPAM